MGLSGSSEGKESACTVGDHGPIPGLGRSPGGGKKELSVNAATRHLNSYSVDSFSHYWASPLCQEKCKDGIACNIGP